MGAALSGQTSNLSTSALRRRVVPDDKPEPPGVHPAAMTTSSFVFQDTNLATHLVRNALGGADKQCARKRGPLRCFFGPFDLVHRDGRADLDRLVVIAALRALLSIPPPLSRRYRDDISALLWHFKASVQEHSMTDRADCNFLRPFKL